MDSAKDIAKDMLESMELDESGFLIGVAKGVIDFPVTFFYLSFDFIDTEHSRENKSDKLRFAQLTKSGVFRHDLFGKIFHVFTKEFISRVDVEYVKNAASSISGNMVGKFIFGEISGVSLGGAIATRQITAFFAGVGVGSVLMLGAEVSRAIYTSRDLRQREPGIYNELRRMGDLDLLYFLVERKVKPFEKALEISQSDPARFNMICKYFFGGL